MFSFKAKFVISYVFTGLLVLFLSLYYHSSFFVLLVLTLLISVVIGLLATFRIADSFGKFQQLINKVSSGYLKLNVDLESAQVISDISESLVRILAGFSTLIDISRKLTKETYGR